LLSVGTQMLTVRISYAKIIGRGELAGVERVGDGFVGYILNIGFSVSRGDLAMAVDDETGSGDLY
jgi:hypothetical protein